MKQKMAVAGFDTLYIHTPEANFKNFSEETKQVVPKSVHHLLD
jgi:hypothetical protein